jgi:hypothetical protein
MVNKTGDYLEAKIFGLCPKDIGGTIKRFYCLCFLFFLLRQGLTVYPRMPLNLKSAFLSLFSAGITCVYHYVQPTERVLQNFVRL